MSDKPQFQTGRVYIFILYILYNIVFNYINISCALFYVYSY